jgi:hypothetical protein
VNVEPRTFPADEAYRMLARFLAELSARVDDPVAADDLDAASVQLLRDLTEGDGLTSEPDGR